jgi:hypothetical protein
MPFSFDWDRCNPLTFSRCVAEYYQNAPTTCSAMFPRSAASNLRLWPRYHLYNICTILCIEFAPFGEGFQNMEHDWIPHDRQHKLRWLNCVLLPIDNNFSGSRPHRIQLLMVADPAKRDRSQILRRILVKHFINAVHVELFMQILNCSFRKRESYFIIYPNRSNRNTSWIHPIPKLSRLFGSEQRSMKRSWPLPNV